MDDLIPSIQRLNPSKSNQDASVVDIEVLKHLKLDLDKEVHRERRIWKLTGLFDQNYCEQGAKIANISVASKRVERSISQSNYTGRDIDWESTEEAKRLLEQIKAHEVTEKILTNRASELYEYKMGWTLRASFMRLFTTSKMSIDISWTGSGKRKPSRQKDFKIALIAAQKARHLTHENMLWNAITGRYHFANEMVAAHLFAWMHGQTTMNAIFGKGYDIFDPRNSLLPKLSTLLRWVLTYPRGYRINIIDKSWDQLDTPITRSPVLTWRDLDNRRLEFKSDFRPAARFLYFHYCVQILRRAWQMTKDTERNEASRDKASDILCAENGKHYWSTPGRYLPKNMLKALVEELGHGYEDILKGYSLDRGDNDALVALVAGHTTARRPLCPFLHEEEEDQTDEEEE
ncbi:hypothetical protein N7495_002201 [Penicillium taxi]|uniref:uncharacterized protein n=1 Tax=Penicillium taxi TaxID=168475 RepID=UPI0025457320|nr:uncharacterized protein N7495_002201 [Penicillium taxi]KAJ5901673.1 hypothetical protein N7495_002201 [Penicillium taxi]